MNALDTVTPYMSGQSPMRGIEMDQIEILSSGHRENVARAAFACQCRQLRAYGFVPPPDKEYEPLLQCSACQLPQRHRYKAMMTFSLRREQDPQTLRFTKAVFGGAVPESD